MKLFEALKNLLKRKETFDPAEVPVGACPNCWGRYEYGGKFYEAVKNENYDVNKANTNVGWVKDYADKHLSGITLQHEDGKAVCQKCNLTFKEV